MLDKAAGGLRQSEHLAFDADVYMYTPFQLFQKVLELCHRDLEESLIRLEMEERYLVFGGHEIIWRSLTIVYTESFKILPSL
jgi:hypothetical protein